MAPSNQLSSSSSQPTKTINQLVVFDFDWSLVDQDTDRYLFEVLAPNLRRLLIERKNELQWTDNVADCLQRLSKRGITKQEIEQAFSTLPLHPAMKRAIQHLSNLIEIPDFTTTNNKNDNNSNTLTMIKTQFLILSNSNTLFIELVLSHYGLYDLFRDSIITNPAHWSQEDPNLIILNRRIDPIHGIKHHCRLGCSPNMCKGEELTAYLNQSSIKFDRIAYIGDGDNDFCPILRLQKHDFGLVRKGRELSNRIKNSKSKSKSRSESQPESESESINPKVDHVDHELKCEILEWDGAWEIEQIFRNVLSF